MSQNFFQRYFSDARRFVPTDLVIVTWQYEVSSDVSGTDPVYICAFYFMFCEIYCLMKWVVKMSIFVFRTHFK